MEEDKKTWQRLIFPDPRFAASIVSVNPFHVPVRYGKGWFQITPVTRKSIIKYTS